MAFYNFGLLICLAEAIWDSLLIKSRTYKQIIIIGAVFALLDIFTIRVVFDPADIKAVAYSGGPHAKGSAVDGIQWNPKFADLRVVLNNPSSDAYKDLNVVMIPDAWINTASIVDGGDDCKLLREPGSGFALSKTGKETRPQYSITAHNAFGQMAFDDRYGDNFTIAATRPGYRLTCDHFAAHDTIQIIFALVSLRKDVLRLVPSPPTKPGQWRLTNAIGPSCKDCDMLDYVLAAEPRPAVIRVIGTYDKNKRYRVYKIVHVADT